MSDPMTGELAEIAAAVAKALGLPHIGRRFQATEPDRSWFNETWTMPTLEADGSNLFAPYWQAHCRDWLLERGYTLTFEPDGRGLHDAYQRQRVVVQGPLLNCPAAEFCARAIHQLMLRDTHELLKAKP